MGSINTNYNVNYTLDLFLQSNIGISSSSLDRFNFYYEGVETLELTSVSESQKPEFIEFTFWPRPLMKS